ncbi:MAG: DUF4198 domain-containing protein [Deltaproteobacteria bacterium]|jgi:uncharacterized GH25 family protein|nr:DUF4198 domain-containing protein [Deltaproteobacteria bacterium]
MKQRVLFIALFMLILSFESNSLAHEYWTEALNPKVNQKLTAIIGRGRYYPVLEEVKAENIPLRFLPPKVYGDNGELTLEQGVIPREYVTIDTVGPGNYVITTDTPGGFSTRTKTGWSYDPKNKLEDAVHCSNYYRYGKEAIILGKAKYSGLAEKPVGQTLEFVPQADPSQIKSGQPFPVKILYKGQPLSGGEVTAVVAGVDQGHRAVFFRSTTDKEGIVNIIPLIAGDWLARVVVEEPYPDQKVCDQYNYTTTYTFKVIK